MDDGTEPQHRFTAVQDYYRALYYEVLDLLVGEISRQFDQDSLALPREIEDLLMKAANDLQLDGSDISIPSIMNEA